MSKLIRVLTYLLVASTMVLCSTRESFADASPPMEPPGSNISPAADTNVQMVAENVLLSISNDSAVSVRADFAMQNRGTEAEVMQVRFPLEHPSGMGDGWGLHPLIRDFSVRVDGKTLPFVLKQEPFKEDGASIEWAAFNVTFPVDEEVIISVSYVTDLYGDSHATVDYILETGAGWYGSIESAVIVLRLPYAASPSNVLTDLAYRPVEEAIFVGNEVRWQWHNLEPTRSDNFEIELVWPKRWQNILDMEARVGESPENIDLVIELAEAYRDEGSERHGFVWIDQLLKLCNNTIMQALALQPNSADLHAQLASIELWKVESFWIEDAMDPLLQPAIREIMIALALDPENQRALDLLDEMYSRLGHFDLPAEIPAVVMPTVIPTPDSSAQGTTLPATATQTRIPASASATPTARPTHTVVPGQMQVEETSDTSPGYPAVSILIGIALISAGAVTGYLFGNRKKE